MARFAQYYIKYNRNIASQNIKERQIYCNFDPYDWGNRQKHLAALFDNDESIEFGEGVPSEEQKACGKKYAKTFKHRVYHLQNNPNIIVMQFANSVDIPVEIDYQPAWAKDEPSCFVIIDNRENLRTVAIQKRKKAFYSPGQVARILADKIDKELNRERCYNVEILPEFYPEDLFQAWEKLQQNVCELRFGVPEITPDEILKKVVELRELGKDYYDDSLMTALLQIALEAKKAKYKYFYKIMPEDKKIALYVDKSSVFMKNLVTLSRAMNMPVELVTKDAGTFKCFVETDEDNTDKIVCREFDANLLEQLFTMKNKEGNQLERGDIMRIEGEIVEMLNSMKHDSDDNEGELTA